MKEIERLADQHARAFDGDPWYGFPLMRVLSGVTADAASARPIPAAHTIWEIVLHIAAWEGAVIKRLKGGEVSLPDEGDWLPVERADEASWREAIRRLQAVHGSLARLMRELPQSRLDERLGEKRDPETGGGVSIATTLHGIVQHSVYHAGQIALLRKAIG